MSARFFRPTWIKLVFLVEWLLFILITWMQGGLETRHQVFIAAYPLLFFYIVAGLFEVLSQKIQQLLRGMRMMILAVSLMLLDQAIKLLVAVFIPFGTAVPLIDGWLNLAHNCNFRGSWILDQLNQPVGSLIPLGIMALLLLVCSWFGYRFYIAHQRASLWADVSLLGLFAGLTGWLLEMLIRGHIVDYLCLPGVVTADLKDIYLTIGVAAIFVETVDNSDISRQWQGWPQERANLWRLVHQFLVFSRHEMKTGWQTLRDKFKQ